MSDRTKQRVSIHLEKAEEIRDKRDRPNVTRFGI